MAKSKRTLHLVNNEHFNPPEPARSTRSSRKQFKLEDLKPMPPKTERQRELLRSFFAQTPIILQMGSAGSGKTAMALHCALTQVLDNRCEPERIIIVRSAVQARDIGFLKGDETEKNEAYERPYQDLCDQLMVYRSDNYKNLKALGLVEFHNSSFMRGQTWHNTIVIFDEAQSANYHEISTAMTRLGDNSRIIFCADMLQSDLHKKGDVSGLPQLQRVLTHMEASNVAVIHYKPEDCIRSGLVRDFLMAQERAGVAA